MERTSSKRGLLLETTSYEQDLSSHSNPLATTSEHSELHAVSPTAPTNEVSQHPLASIQQQPQTCGSPESYTTTTITRSRPQSVDELLINPIILPPPMLLPAPQAQYHINLSADADVLLKRAQELGLLDPLNSAALPQLQRLLASNLSNKLQADPSMQQIHHVQQPMLQQPSSHLRFNSDETTMNPNHQYNLSTINERTSPNGSPEDGYREGGRPSTSSVVNGLGSGCGGITSLTDPSPVQQVIGALQDTQKQQDQQRRRVKDLKSSSIHLYKNIYNYV